MLDSVKTLRKTKDNCANRWVSCGCNVQFSACCTGSSVSGYDDTSSDNSTANAADSSAAGPEPSAAPGSSPAAAGPHVTAGNVHVTSAESFIIDNDNSIILQPKIFL